MKRYISIFEESKSGYLRVDLVYNPKTKNYYLSTTSGWNSPESDKACITQELRELNAIFIDGVDAELMLNGLNKLDDDNYSVKIYVKSNKFGAYYEQLKEKKMKRYRSLFNEASDFDRSAYLKWKRQNVTYRGIKKSIEIPNEVYGSWGKGLYTTFLSNKAMAKQYGKVYFVVGAIPKKPLVVQSLNSAEILRQKLIIEYCKKNGSEKEYDLSFFEKHTSMDKELIKQGYDGFIIKSRELVNYLPSNNIKYFETEEQLINYFIEKI